MQKGRSMIEMLGVLIIITVLTIGAMTGWQHTRQKMKIAETQNEIALIEQDISNLFAWARRYPEAVSMETLCKEEVFPSGCSPSNCVEEENCVAYHPFDRNASLRPGTYEVEFDSGYLVIVLRYLPDMETCREIKSAIALEHYVGGECSNGSNDEVLLELMFQ